LSSPSFTTISQIKLIVDKYPAVCYYGGMEHRTYFTQDDLNTNQALVKAINLVERNQRIIAMYRQGMTMQEIGDEVGKTKARVSQILAIARRNGVDVSKRTQPEPAAQD
jgi:hypothetical protein